MSGKNVFETPSIESETVESLSEKLLTTTQHLVQANLALQQMQKERNEMLANISHDLRAPITAIRSAVDYLLSTKNLSEADCEASLQLIDRRTKTLEHLIQDMYFLFSVEDASRALALETVEAAPFLEEYFYDAIADTRYDKHNMHLEISENLHCTIEIDLQKMVRVLDNLFTNAVKYSPAGSDITLKVVLAKDRQSLVICVIDTGIGIPAKDLTHIFKRTYTVSSARTPGTATGSGLGLAIVKAIVERFNGTISCTSKEGAGSCFSITLPCKPGE